MKNNFDYQKEQYRGTLKQIMKVRGLRTISISNYEDWKAANGEGTERGCIHSLKLDLQDGYINAYGYNGAKCGEKIEDCSGNQYKYALNVVNEIIARESEIPYKVRRNIFVKMCR